MCGENTIADQLIHLLVGSSPRVRGKPSFSDRHPPPHWLIPACAGKTRRDRVQYARKRAHPRVCGENEKLGKLAQNSPGSSPRVRGKRGDCRCSTQRKGLIPACAGKTGTLGALSIFRWAHPRVCGENLQGRVFRRVFGGSSPRVRGKRVGGPYNFFVWGLIPACAGKTHGNGRGSGGSAAHPRVCGENAVSRGLCHIWVGSSPRVRGKPRRRRVLYANARLIPACAGKTTPQ